MSFRLRAFLIGGLLVGVLAFPAFGSADHIGLEGTVEAVLTGTDPDRAKIRVNARLECAGAVAGDVSYEGSLYLAEVATGDERLIGYVTARSARIKTSEPREQAPREVIAVLRASCSEQGAGAPHSSGVVEFFSEPLTIPPRDGGGGNGGGGGGGGGGGDDPLEEQPLVPGGCAAKLKGGPGEDELTGTADGDLIFGFEGSDRLRGLNGHDCLIGGQDNDRLSGGHGSDRLTGSGGNDRLNGGPGKNFYDAGPGKDRVEAGNGHPEVVRCGPGADYATVDPDDRVRSCEETVVGV